MTVYRTHWRLPKDFTCKHCTLEWHWVTASSWCAFLLVLFCFCLFSCCVCVLRFESVCSSLRLCAAAVINGQHGRQHPLTHTRTHTPTTHPLSHKNLHSWPRCPGSLSDEPTCRNAQVYGVCGTPGTAYPEEFSNCADVAVVGDASRVDAAATKPAWEGLSDITSGVWGRPKALQMVGRRRRRAGR